MNKEEINNRLKELNDAINALRDAQEGERKELESKLGLIKEEEERAKYELYKNMPKHKFIITFKSGVTQEVIAHGTEGGSAFAYTGKKEEFNGWFTPLGLDDDRPEKVSVCKFCEEEVLSIIKKEEEEK